MYKRDSSYFGLKDYEYSDLMELIHFNKKFDGFVKVKLNWIDRFVAKEHKYGYNRMCVFAVWMVLGSFIPFWILFGFLLNTFIGNFDSSAFLSFIICIVIGIVMQVRYTLSCNKIDYNTLINKNKQISIFEYMENDKRGD